MNWQDEVECVGLNPIDADRFFSDDPLEQAIMAQEFCYSCPVRDLCLQTALDSKTYWGVWGGATQEHLRDALGLDENGRTDPGRKDYTLCPRCRMDDYTAIEPTRMGTVVRCNDCDITWETRASVDLTR